MLFFFDDILGSSIYERISLILKKYVEKMHFFHFFLLANRMTALFVKKTFLMISPLAFIAKCSFFLKDFAVSMASIHGKSCFRNFEKSGFREPVQRFVHQKTQNNQLLCFFEEKVLFFKFLGADECFTF